MKAWGLALALVLAAGASAAQTAPEDTEAAVTYLLEAVAAADLQFLRNGQAYDGPAAAAHLRRKYAHFREQIARPEDFIRLCATASLATGRPYRVRRPDGTIQPCGEWLLEVLERYRREGAPHP